MKKNNPSGEYELLVHSIDGTVAVYRLNRKKFRLFTLGRNEPDSRHLSVKLTPDDASEKKHWLSSMQCYFAWDKEKNDWVVGNGLPPSGYIPSSAIKHFKTVSPGPKNAVNITHVFCNNSRPELLDKTSLFQQLAAPQPCSNVLALAFIKTECEPRYNGDIVVGVEGWTEEVGGQVSFAYLIEVVPLYHSPETTSCDDGFLRAIPDLSRRTQMPPGGSVKRGIPTQPVKPKLPDIGNPPRSTPTDKDLKKRKQKE